MADRREERQRAALICNPIKVREAASLRSLLQRVSRDNGWAPPLLLETTAADPGQGATRDALDKGVDVVLVAGGDGTVRAVSEAMRRSGVPLAIIPRGTGNLFARNLGIPLSGADIMVRAALTGDVRPVDIGVATLTRREGASEQHAFVVLAGMGLDAAMIANTSPERKRQIGWVAYVDGAARSLPRAKPFRLAYQFAGRSLHSVKVQAILFANCGALPAGIELVPDARIDDGVLDVALIQAAGPLGWLGVWRKVWWDNSVLRRSRVGRRVVERTRNQSIRYVTGQRIEAASNEPLPVELDGDEFGNVARIRCEIDEGGLLVAVPRGHVLPKRPLAHTPTAARS
ncbi:diacylglycerol/lipid kinase family protein [Microbacterium amylolyticum]|uniref:Diacylglycerol kinase family enzyme n=1 Tax=Microbacterium amylolyticum TaxID=936337 RepID=A0ABS4ZGG7_9MICO|nr:diacylglycerol kinase family protein [Microbacterium amylolyticum]MBP2436379.1 diacylglycerol kinase family enzyme [Microbacterium amylolyticum]